MDIFKLGQIITNRVDSQDKGHYQIVLIKRIANHWMYKAVPVNPHCMYASIGGSL